MSEAATPTGANVDVALGVQAGKVVLKWHTATNCIVFDPQNAFTLGEAIARAAHEARYGDKPASDQSYIAEQVRARITEDVRDKLVARVALMLHSLRGSTKSDGEVAMHVVDTLLAKVA